MKITDETKEFISTHRFGTDKLRLDVASNFPGSHETPSLFLRVYDPFRGEEATFGTKDIDQIKEIIQHMAKMAGLDVEITEPVDFTPKYQKGDRVRSLMLDEHSELGTVMHDEPQKDGWNVRVMLDGRMFPGRYAYHELQRVTGE